MHARPYLGKQRRDYLIVTMNSIGFFSFFGNLFFCDKLSKRSVPTTFFLHIPYLEEAGLFSLPLPDDFS